jgi:hypothetical protein
MGKIGVGVIGCGFVGRGAHVPALSAIEDAALVAVADADETRLNKAVRKHGVKSGYRDYAELVKDSDVQAVIVSVPTPLHAKATLAAIEAGKHVLCEMPLAPTFEEVDKMTEAAKKKGVFLMPSLNFRFTPNYVKAKEMMSRDDEQGRAREPLGRPLSGVHPREGSGESVARQVLGLECRGEWRPPLHAVGLVGRSLTVVLRNRDRGSAHLDQVFGAQAVRRNTRVR